ncbi:MAG TPA: pyrroline-5-carboxylate reductase [Gammaproteobacteria bacterium]|nr:pyrroline-5-carboxylate reductase [Gammaproteobacteria bacterium]
MAPPLLAFIGAGNMGRCLIGGLLANGYPATRIRAADADATQLAALNQSFPVATTTDNVQAASGADIVVLAVKPQQMRAVATALAPVLAARPSLVVSIAAGIATRDLARWLGTSSIVRAMPNTPALMRSGISGLYAAPGVGAAQRAQAENILRAVGLVVWVADEDLIDAITAVSGGGPAYFFLIMELMQSVAQKLGLTADQARTLVIQTASGAARMAREGGADVTVLRGRVTSAGGTTERALRVMQEAGLAEIFDRALTAAKARSAEMARQYGEE